MDTTTTAQQPKAAKKSNTMVFLLLALAIIWYMIFSSRREPVAPQPPASTPAAAPARAAAPQIDYAALVAQRSGEAHRRNHNAQAIFAMEINQIISSHESALATAAAEAAKAASTYSACSQVVYCLAWDKVKKETRTEQYLESKIGPVISPAIRAMTNEVDAATSKFDYELRRSTVQLAHDLAALGPMAQQYNIPIESAIASRSDFQKALRNIGFSATALSGFALFDAGALWQAKGGIALWRKLGGVCLRLFGKPVATATASITAAAADGPLPFGDVLAVGGAIWTCYDIHRARCSFEKDLQTALANMNSEVKNDLRRQAVAHAEALIKQYQQLQDDIGSHALQELTMKGE